MGALMGEWMRLVMHCRQGQRRVCAVGGPKLHKSAPPPPRFVLGGVWGGGGVNHVQPGWWLMGGWS